LVVASNLLYEEHIWLNLRLIHYDVIAVDTITSLVRVLARVAVTEVVAVQQILHLDDVDGPIIIVIIVACIGHLD
jgi:hypothetical protein